MTKAQILSSHFSRHLQGHFFFRRLSLEYAFGSSNTNLRVLAILVIIMYLLLLIRRFSVNFKKFLLTASFIEHLCVSASVNFILESLHRCFRYFQQKLIRINYTYIQITDRCILNNIHNYVICNLQQQVFYCI